MAVPPEAQGTNLPADLTTFVGRRDELEEIRHSLESSRLVTIMGVGGVGKTRLALRAASQAQKAFPDGVWLVELAGLQTEDLLPQAIVSALGIRDQSTRWTTDSLAKHIENRRLLLVLDNCEHLQAACAELAADLLRRCPLLRILATSRHALGIAGEFTRSLQPLRFPTVNMPAPAMLRFEAVELLKDRIRSVLPGFTVDDGNAYLISRLCQRLEGIPLAIELAAAKLRLLSVEQLMERLEDRFSVLSSSDRSALPRHQTLRALIDWSFDLCTEGEKTLWARLSVFAQSCDLVCVEGVCSDEDLSPAEAFDALAGLLDKSILAREERDGRVRYRMLETIREYARETLRQSGKEELFRRRHRDWYLDLAEQMRAAWFGPDQSAWFIRMRTDHPNLRLALQFCLDQEGEIVEGMRIAAGLGDYWRASGFMSEARRWFERLLEHHSGPSTARLRVLTTAAYFALLQGDAETAGKLIDENRELAARAGDEHYQDLLKVPEGFAALFRGDFPSGIAICKEFVDGEHTDDELSWLANGLVVLGMGASAAGRTEEAITYWMQLLELSEAHGEQWRRSYALWGLGIEAWHQHDFRRARALERESIALRHSLDDHFGTALCTETLAWIAASENQNHDAARLLGMAQMLRQETTSSLFTFFIHIHERCQSQVRGALGHRVYQQDFDEGRRITFEQAVIEILQEDRSSPLASDPSARLTKREREIAQFVAKGMTNKQIANALVLSPRTVESHIDHILAKLGFSSRHEITAWLIEKRAESKNSL